MRHHFDTIANSETRINYGAVNTSGNTVAPLVTEEFLQRVTSGTYFGRLGWTLTGDATRDVQSAISNVPFSGSTLKDDLVRADLKYAVLRPLAATASVGYERISDVTLVPSPHGPTWSVGFQYTPIRPSH